MGESQTPRAPRVFLSYASEDVNWVQQFKQWLVGPLGNVVIVDFKDGSNLEFGPLGSWLDARVDEAAVMVAFVSSHYTQKVWTQAEWQSGLSKTQRGQLIFVPVVMDADSKVWWAQLRKKGDLAVLPADFQYADFTMDGSPAQLIGDGPFVTRISQVALKIRNMLAKPAGETLPSPDPPGPIPDVVLLGHPFGRFDVALEEQVKDTDELLRKRSVVAKKWGDGWWNDPARRVLPSSGKPIFVRPLAPGEIEQSVSYAGKTSERLISMKVTEPRVVLWLPNADNDPVFKADAGAASANAFPALRTDTPQGLAAWLGDLVHPSAPDAVVVQIETVGYPDDTVPDVITVQLADTLQQRFSGIVNREILPNPGLWPFWGEEINEQMKILPGNRVIIAVHDLDIAPSADPEVFRAKLETKLSVAQEAVALANKENSSGRTVDPFFTALLVKNAKALPFGNYASNGRFKDWRLLRFETAELKPLPASLAVFRGQLNKWAANRAPAGVAA
jgi:hypothetical protein